MATRLKTIRYAVPVTATVVDATKTSLTTITAYIPEFSGTVTIKKVLLETLIHEGATMAVSNYTTRRAFVSVGGAAETQYDAVTATHTKSGEQTSVFMSYDVTTHFTTNWTSGTSKTLATAVTFDASGATVALVDASASYYITYEYDDTQATQIKTVYIPLNAPTTTLATSKPGSATATIPALDTELPESSKTYRNMHIVLQGNINNTASTTDSTISVQIETYTAYTTQSLEMGATSDYWTKFNVMVQYYDSGGASAGLGMATNVTRGYYIWGSVARFNHCQAYLVVTYEFDATGSTDCFNSVMLPLGQIFPMGGVSTAATDYTRGIAELWIEEPDTITTKQIAAYLFWHQAAAMATGNVRIGTGSFGSITDGAAVLCGQNGCMIRNDSAFALARGRNVLNVDAYSSDTSDRMWALNGFLIVNYTSGKPTNGYGAANHTVFYPIIALEAIASTAAAGRLTSAAAIAIPETEYFVTGMALVTNYDMDGTTAPTSVMVAMEKTSGEGGVQWFPIFGAKIATDAEGGYSTMWNCLCPYIKRFPADLTPNVVDPETSRRYFVDNTITSYHQIELALTYHTNTFAVSGTVINSGGGTVTIYAYDTTDRRCWGTTSRVGDGSYSITVYDSSRTHFTESYEDGTHIGRSDNSTPT